MTLTNANSIIDNHFRSIVGQGIAKARLRDILLAGVQENGFLAPTLLIAPPGLGKTRLLAALQAAAKEIFKRKHAFFPSGKEMGSVASIFEDVLVPHFHAQPAIMFADEFHEAAKPVHGLVRSMVEVTAKREPKEVTRGALSVTVNPRLHGFFLATNRVDELDPALLSRFERIDLALYTDEEMEEILFDVLIEEKITFHENTLRRIAECNRGNARDVIHWSNAVRRHLSIAGKTTVNKADVAEIIRKREAFPLGVTRNELATLLHLEKFGELQMKELAARNLCAPAEQNANERYLLQKGFLTIEVKRKLTQAGREYLRELRDEKFIPEVGVKA